MKEPRRRFHMILLFAYVLAIVWTSLAYEDEPRVAASSAPASVGIPKSKTISIAVRGQSRVREYVRSASKAAGVNPRVAEWIVSHESHHYPQATGDGGESRGLWQINKEWHPEVSDACAYDVRCSTHWSLERIRAGYAHEWSTWKYCRAKFEDCPF